MIMIKQFENTNGKDLRLQQQGALRRFDEHVCRGTAPRRSIRKRSYQEEKAIEA
jgi:hypothetical protein